MIAYTELKGLLNDFNISEETKRSVTETQIKFK